MRCATKEVRGLLKQLRVVAPDLDVSLAGSGHIKIRRDGSLICTIPATTSDHRALKNVRAQLRRNGVRI